MFEGWTACRPFDPYTCSRCEAEAPAGTLFWAINVTQESPSEIGIQVLSSFTPLVLCQPCSRLCDLPSVHVPRMEMA